MAEKTNFSMMSFGWVGGGVSYYLKAGNAVMSMVYYDLVP